ncbi:MAG: GumC family protein, partial [Methylobacterium sp.]
MFYADRIDAARAPTSASSSSTPGDPARSLFDPLTLAGEVWRRRRMVLLAGVVGLVLAGGYASTIPTQYTAVTQLVIDPRNLNLVQNEVTETPTGMTTDATLALIESQIAVMTSNSVLGRVVAQTSLTADPEFNGTRTNAVSRIAALVSALVSRDPAKAVRDREQVTINALRERMSATRTANSFVISLAVKSEDPEKAARLANLTTEVFIAEQGRAQSEVARRATAALSSRLAELRQSVVDAEGAVETYKAENKLVGVGGRLIDDDYITRVNNQLADVRSQITSLNVRAESLRRADVDDVVGGSYPEGLNAESLLRLRQTYSEAAQNQAILATRLGPRHPQRIAAEQAVATARRAIQGELARIVASAQTELARAEQTERDLSSQIDTLRARQIETSGAFVRLRELEREVDASRAVYEAYLLRARQTSEQESLNTANVRVISDAVVPMDPSGSSRKLLAILGLLGGLMLGAGIALVAGLVSLVRRPVRALSVERWSNETPDETPAPQAAYGAQRLHFAAGPAGLDGSVVTAETPKVDRADETAKRAGAMAAGWALRGPAGERSDAPAVTAPLADTLPEAAPASAADSIRGETAQDHPETVARDGLFEAAPVSQ